MPVSSANPTWQILILMRHAKRAGGLDSLAPDGHKQAVDLPGAIRSALRKIGKHEGLSDLALLDTSAAIRWRTLASPKRRTQQTLRFLSETAGVTSEILSELDERRTDESVSSFESRVRNLLETWHEEMLQEQTQTSSVREIRVACSHLDWLESASLFLSSDESDLERSTPWLPMDTRIYLLKNGIWNRVRR
jgi:hypothetical protein